MLTCVQGRNGTFFCLGAQTGVGSGLQCGLELDYFLSPVDSLYNQVYPANLVASAPLSTLSNLTLAFGANVRVPNCCLIQ